ncbi:DivIVA domain-containing protein [Roseivirga sp. BDSF3-8]|uniref:DivIVA domain-containing protein n=1 Tax=Roseivirga sp. BDSF3-8 TaxID=3241598 RepID=UPI00353238CC
MKVTPLEIRQKTFEKVFRGYDKDEVNAFLLTLSQEWERLVDEHKEMRIKLENSREEVEKLREVESSLFKTLKTAEDTGANMIEQANKTAELHLKETQMKADGLLNDAKNRARAIMEEAESKSRQVLEHMEDDARHLEDNCRKLEDYRDTLLSEMRHLAESTIERVEKAKNSRRDFNLDERIGSARHSQRESLNKLSFEKEEMQRVAPPPMENPRTQQHSSTPGEETSPTEEEDTYTTGDTYSAEETNQEEEQKNKGKGSFFDDIE